MNRSQFRKANMNIDLLTADGSHILSIETLSTTGYWLGVLQNENLFPTAELELTTL